MNEPTPLKWPPGEDDWDPILLHVRTVCLRVIRSYRLDDNDLADAVQTVCMGLCSAKKQPHFENWNQLSVWVRTVVTHHVFALHRQRLRWDAFPNSPPTAESRDAETSLITSELLDGLADPEQREAVRLHYIESRTIGEIAERMGVSNATASRRITNAIQAMRRRGRDD